MSLPVFISIEELNDKLKQEIEKYLFNYPEMSVLDLCDENGNSRNFLYN
jgi:hypothetical protein